MIRVGDQWLADFASCNYLGFDLEREIIDAIPAYLDKWGTHPSWSRLLGSPVLYTQIEERLAELLGAEDTLVLPTITLIHMSVIPVLAGRRHDLRRVACAQDDLRGLPVRRSPRRDSEAVRFRGSRRPGAPAQGARPLAAPDLRRRSEQHDRQRHRSPSPSPASRASTTRFCTWTTLTDSGSSASEATTSSAPYGNRGNSIVRYAGETYENVILVSGLSKAYSSLAAFLTCPPELKRLLKTAAPPYLYSGPSPIASLATVLAGLDLNEQRGDAIRAGLWRKTATVLDCLDRLGVHTPNRSGFPIIEVPLARHGDIDAVGRFLFDNGVYVTLAAYPLVPRDEVGFRVQVTAANTRRGDRAARRRARSPHGRVRSPARP